MFINCYYYYFYCFFEVVGLYEGGFDVKSIVGGEDGVFIFFIVV